VSEGARFLGKMRAAAGPKRDYMIKGAECMIPANTRASLICSQGKMTLIEPLPLGSANPTAARAGAL
jgi:hypothetical protein